MIKITRLTWLVILKSLTTSQTYTTFFSYKKGDFSRFFIADGKVHSYSNQTPVIYSIFKIKIHEKELIIINISRYTRLI